MASWSSSVPLISISRIMTYVRRDWQSDHDNVEAVKVKSQHPYRAAIATSKPARRSDEPGCCCSSSLPAGALQTLYCSHQDCRQEVHGAVAWRTGACLLRGHERTRLAGWFSGDQGLRPSRALRGMDNWDKWEDATAGTTRLQGHHRTRSFVCDP